MIDFDEFVEWAEKRFGDIIVHGEEIRANSIFHPTKSDTKYRLWMKPSGDTKNGDRADGVYHCFDTDQKGSLIGLIMLVDGCGYGEACNKVGSSGNLAKLEKKVEEFFRKKQQNIEEEVKPTLLLPPGSFSLSYSSDDKKSLEACFYLDKRKISPDGFYFCNEGTYKNRIIIPYYDKEGKLVYYNSRTFGKFKSYLCPPKECGVSKEDVVYMPEWPKSGTKIYLTEGEFDAKTLNICGLYGAGLGGKVISDKQITLLKDYKLCLALDNDDAGKGSVLKIYEKLRARGIMNFSYVFPPKLLKDWNNLYLKTDKSILKAFIEKNEKSFTEAEFLNMTINKLM